MKCTNKFAVFILVPCLLAQILCGCTPEESADSYRTFESSYSFGITKAAPMENTTLFSDNIIVAPKEDKGLEPVSDAVATTESCAVFNITTRDTLLSKSCYEKVYPASTTKILTAYIALTEGDLDEVFTASENACDQESDSSVAGLSTGDNMTLNDLLYGLMLPSGNDAAIAIAEGMYGSTSAFADRMNEVANNLGATHSHFITVNGLPDDDHYVTAYDMYLIFNEAIKLDSFRNLISTPTYTSYYTGADGSPKEATWNSTTRYINGKMDSPEGITVIGGKTGTTGEAGYCLVLLSRNSNGEELISMVFGADSRWDLYNCMSQILKA